MLGRGESYMFWDVNQNQVFHFLTRRVEPLRNLGKFWWFTKQIEEVNGDYGFPNEANS